MKKKTEATPKTTTPKTEATPKTEEKVKPTMAGQLKKHKASYAACVTHTNSPSLNNGDSVATILAGADPVAVVKAAELLLGFKKGELVERYSHLNNGQRRMNAGNRIRSAVKKGIVTAEQVTKALH